MTKVELTEMLSDRIGLDKTQAAEALDQVLEMIKAALESGEDVKLTNFGTFQVREKKARPGRNPITGDEITISARRVVTFKPSQTLRSELNS